jgi:signal transduction histidine kinase
MTIRLPRSLFARLLGIAAITMTGALAFAAISIGHVLERFVIRGLDQQLDAQIGSVARAVRPDGTLDEGRIVSLPAFAEPGSAWGWQVDGPLGRHRGLGAEIDAGHLATLTSPLDHGPSRETDGPYPRPGDTRAVSGDAVHFRQLLIRTTAGSVLVTASGPRRVAMAPLREAMLPLLGSLALLGLGLAVATVVQLRFGLRPLRALQASLAEVRSGRERHVPADQPDELAPLARELNALIDQNQAGLEHARRHVANLAHGLKTPLAALSLKLAEHGSDPDGTRRELVARIDRHVRHHLGRARAAGSGGTRARTSLAPAIADLRHVLERVHAERPITGSFEIPSDLSVAIDAQDLDEIAGNLLDNAWRHAKSTISVAAARVAASIELTIDDDGVGVPETALAEALQPGRRLDERGDGHGFGLSIAAELAELNGGTLTLSRSPTLGGLQVRLVLPARD